MSTVVEWRNTNLMIDMYKWENFRYNPQSHWRAWFDHIQPEQHDKS